MLVLIVLNILLMYGLQRALPEAVKTHFTFQTFDRLKLDHATASFQGSSLKIRAIIDYLKSSQQHQELLELLQRLQFQEQAKMKFTLIVQVLHVFCPICKFCFAVVNRDKLSNREVFTLCRPFVVQSQRVDFRGRSLFTTQPLQMVSFACML